MQLPFPSTQPQTFNPACHLQASEAALEQDSQRFEENLKENDAKLQEALLRADAERRARVDKEAEAKRLAGAIAGIKGEVAKIEEQLQECQRWVGLDWAEDGRACQQRGQSKQQV
jgi:chromosome segregation ATPase